MDIDGKLKTRSLEDQARPKDRVLESRTELFNLGALRQ